MARPSRATAKVVSGRLKRGAAQAAVEAPISVAPAKQGRATKVDAAEHVEAPSKKRGRPAKAEVAEEEEEVQEPPQKRGRPGRASNAIAVEPAAEIVAEAPKKRGRPAKTDTAVVVEKPAKRRGRPAKIAEEIQEPVQETVEKKRAGRPRKDDIPATPRKTSTPKATGTRRSPRRSTIQPTPASLIRSNRPGSRLRNRVPPAPPKKQTHVTVSAKRRGRPPKNGVKPKALAPQAKNGPGRKSTARTLSAPAKITKAAAPRKRRGYTTIEVPDKFAEQANAYIESLVNPEGEKADEAEDLVPADVEDIVEIQDGSSGSDVGEEEGALSDEEQQEEEVAGEPLPNGQLSREVSMGYDGLIEQSSTDPDPAEDADVEDADVPVTHIEVTDVQINTTGGASPSSEDNEEALDGDVAGEDGYVHSMTKSQTVQIEETNEEGETQTSVLQVEEELNFDDFEQPAMEVEGSSLLGDVPFPAVMTMSG